MLSGECIICFAPDPWADIWRNRHRLLSVFSRTNRVLYVEPRLHVRPLARRLRSGEIRPRDFFRRRIEEVQKNLFVYHDPLFLPRTGWRGIGKAMDRLRQALLERAVRRLGFARPVLWLVRPSCWDVLGKFDEKAVLYQIVDDYLSYPGVTPRARERLEREERVIAGHADLVVVTAETLLAAKRGLHPNVILIPNGVDEGTLEEGRRAGGDVPRELVEARKPVLGYLGGITEKLDLELLEKVARSLEAASTGTLVLVGPVNVASVGALRRIERLRASPAVLFTGKKEAMDVPAFLRGFDVGLIPYAPGEQSRSIDPLKLYEYLAFGIPVVAADIPSMRPHAAVVRVAADHATFLAHLGEAALERDEALAARRRAIAAENGWERRADQISDALEAALRTRSR
ncbi:MAG TPA: glycosyltransferase [Planctomycetota bacterium]|nr:glycosyltransferase [Planctomycetota bacterium]